MPLINGCVIRIKYSKMRRIPLFPPRKLPKIPKFANKYLCCTNKLQDDMSHQVCTYLFINIRQKKNQPKLSIWIPIFLNGVMMTVMVHMVVLGDQSLSVIKMNY